MPIPLVIDTDTAQDDCVAILTCVLDPAADVKAITMVAGNVGFEQQVRNAFLTLSVAGKLDAVPVHLGCQQPFLRPWISAENVHGDGVGGLSIDMTDLVPNPEHGVDALIRLAAENPGELCIVAIGPLTNIAVAAAKDRDFVRNVKALHIMGGSNNGRGNITAAGEFNFYVDPEAAKAVFAAGFNIVIIPWDPLTLRDAVFGTDRLDRIAAIDTPLAQFFTTIVGATLDFDRSVGIDGSTHPDSLDAAVLLHPELVLESSEYHVDVECGSDLTRGYSAMSWGVHELVANATVIESVDSDAFFEHIVGILSQQTVPSRSVQSGPTAP
ncbi:MAG: nucleoside hydrolase [Nakamurella sp.]